MSVASESVEIPDYPLDVSMVAFADMVKILGALGNEDALAIFLYTKDEIRNSQNVIRTLGLTQKRFYSRLKDLLDNQLVEKVEGVYRHTALGNILCEVGISLEELLLNKDKLNLINQIKQTNGLSERDRSMLDRMFSIKPFNINKDVKIVELWEDLVRETNEMISGAEEEILMATQYLDARTIDSGFKAINRGVKVRSIASANNQMTEGLKILFSFITNPKQLVSFSSILKSDQIQVRFSSVPYTFLIVDQKQSMIEIKNPVTDDYGFAIIINNEIFSKKLVSIFNSIFETGTDYLEKIKF